MVDFQSRDTRRTLGGDESEDGSEDESGDGSEDGSGDESEDGAEEVGTGAADSGSDAATDDEPAAPAANTADDDASGEEGEGADDDSAAPDGMTYALVTVGAPADELDPADVAMTALDGTEASVVTRRSVEATADAVQSAVGDQVDRPDVAAVVTFGGIGVGPDDVTPEAVEPLLDRRMDGFGELYRVLAHEREGTAVVRARVTAGLVGPVPVFCLPGDPDAARHGVDGLVLAEAEAIVDEATRDDSPDDA